MIYQYNTESAMKQILIASLMEVRSWEKPM